MTLLIHGLILFITLIFTYLDMCVATTIMVGNNIDLNRTEKLENLRLNFFETYRYID